jgi:hypothetical protein
MGTWIARIVVVLASAIAIALFAFQADRLTDPQQPHTIAETATYYQVGDQRPGAELFEQAVPPTVPLIYRAVGRDSSSIERAQRDFSLVAWLLLAASLVFVCKRPMARALGAIVILGMALAPARLGFTAVATGASFNDSLFAIVMALALSLLELAKRAPRLHVVATVVLPLLSIAWIFASDTNAFTVLASVGVGLVVWWPDIRNGRARWALAPLLLGLLAALLDITAARATPPGQTFSRATRSVVGSIAVRVMPDADARQYFADAGLPLSDDKLHMGFDATTWLADHAITTYAQWLVTHPGARAKELWAGRAAFGAPDLSRVMPPGWVSWDTGDPITAVWRHVTANAWVLLGMLVLAPVCLWRLRSDPRAGFALCLLLGGVMTALASFYMDAADPDLHVYGSVQQVALGLVIAIVAALDRLLEARRALRSRVTPAK